MKIIHSAIMILLAIGLFLILPANALAADKSLADILREKGILTEEEYQEAIKVEQSEAAKTEAAVKAAEAAKTEAAKVAGAKPVAGYDRGFYLQSPDGKLKLTFTGYVRGLLELYENNTLSDNAFRVERARPALRLALGKYWDGQISAELTTVSDSRFLKYAYINNSYLPYLQVRGGQFKVPFCREYLTSFADVETIERAMVADSGATVPKYDIGVMLHGPSALKGLINYGVGVFNGNGANNFDSNDDMDVIGRLVLAPFAPTDQYALRGLEFGGYFQSGRQTPTQSWQPVLPTQAALSSAERTFFPSYNYRGQRDRYGFEFSYKWSTPSWGGFKLQSEVISQRLERDDVIRVDPNTNKIVSSGGKLINAPDLLAYGWYALGAVYVWGNENKGIQLVGRYEQFDADDEGNDKYQDANPMGDNSYANRFGNPLNIRGNTANILTLGLNYFPLKNVRLAFNWIYTDVDNPYTTDKIKHDENNNEYVTGGGGGMNVFYLLGQIKW